MLFRALQHGRRGPIAVAARGFKDAATTQMTLNAHPKVAVCVVTTNDSTSKLQITVLPKATMDLEKSIGVHGHLIGRTADVLFTTVALWEDEVREYLASKGFDGEGEVRFAENEEDVPQSSHERVVLLDLLQACFKDADQDSDGAITMTEFKEFVGRHGIVFDGETWMEVFTDADPNRDYKLSFGEFKNLLLQTRLVALQDNLQDGREAEFGVHTALRGLLATHIFQKADADKDGRISREEVQQLLKSFSIARAELPKDEFEKLFSSHDTDQDGSISVGEFEELLLSTHLVGEPAKKEEKDSWCSIL